VAQSAVLKTVGLLVSSPILPELAYISSLWLQYGSIAHQPMLGYIFELSVGVPGRVSVILNEINWPVVLNIYFFLVLRNLIV
jgi:hypothetical protein